MKHSIVSGLMVSTLSVCFAAPVPPDDGKLRIICFGAHPDDCELQAGGVGAMWAAKGHHVKLVSVTNGDIGHWREARRPPARPRQAEAQRADAIIGGPCGSLDIYDGGALSNIRKPRMNTRLI